MGTLALAIAAALEAGGMRSPDIADAGVAPFVLAVIAGALAAWVASFGAGILGGALTGLAYALGGGIVQAFAAGSGMPRSTIIAALLLMTLAGAVLGALASLPVALVRMRRERKRVRRF